MTAYDGCGRTRVSSEITWEGPRSPINVVRDDNRLLLCELHVVEHQAEKDVAGAERVRIRFKGSVSGPGRQRSTILIRAPQGPS